MYGLYSILFHSGLDLDISLLGRKDLDVNGHERLFNITLRHKFE